MNNIQVSKRREHSFGKLNSVNVQVKSHLFNDLQLRKAQKKICYQKYTIIVLHLIVFSKEDF